MWRTLRTSCRREGRTYGEGVLFFGNGLEFLVGLEEVAGEVVPVAVGVVGAV